MREQVRSFMSSSSYFDKGLLQCIKETPYFFYDCLGKILNNQIHFQFYPPSEVKYNLISIFKWNILTF